MIMLIAKQWMKIIKLTDYKRQADLDHIEEDIFDRPPTANLTMRLMQIILNAFFNSSKSAEPPNLIPTTSITILPPLQLRYSAHLVYSGQVEAGKVSPDDIGNLSKEGFLVFCHLL